jgi:hypothetical protein
MLVVADERGQLDHSGFAEVTDSAFIGFVIEIASVQDVLCEFGRAPVDVVVEGDRPEVRLLGRALARLARSGRAAQGTGHWPGARLNDARLPLLPKAVAPKPAQALGLMRAKEITKPPRTPAVVHSTVRVPA